MNTDGSIQHKQITRSITYFAYDLKPISFEVIFISESSINVGILLHVYDRLLSLELSLI